MSDAGEHIAQGLAAHQSGRLDEAERLYRLALGAQPRSAEALHLLGLVMHQTGRTGSALGFLKGAVREASLPQHRLSLASVLVALGRHAEAAVELRRFLAESPADAEAALALAAVSRSAGVVASAVIWARRTLAVRSDYAEAAYNLGNWLQAIGQTQAALVAYRRALAARGDYGDALANLAPALLDFGRPSGAWQAARQAIALAPSHAAALNNHGQAVQAAGMTRPATVSFRRALAAEPQLVAAHSNYLFSLSYAPETTHGELFAAYQEWAVRHAPSPAAWPRHRNSRDGERRLRIGYLSADLADHPVGHNLIGLIEAHDRQSVELYAYAAVSRPDPMTARFRRAFSHWRDLEGIDDARAAQLVRTDAIDILVSIAGHTAHNRLMVAAQKPAPVQASLYDLSTTGLAAMDAWFTDPALHPSDSAERFTEHLVPLPCLYLHAPPDPSPEPGSAPAEEAGRITFGSCNNPAKLTDAVLALWARVMGAVPGSRLLMKYQDRFADAALQRRVTALFGDHGIARDRLDFVGGRLPRAGQLAILNRVDIALDPFPFNGSTTTFEALWMGVPVVSLAGDRFLGRVGASFLAQIGLGSLVAADAEAYVRLARELAADAPRRARLRQELRPRLLASPLCDAPAHARAFEAALRALWRAWCSR
ncbi:MAG: hypothetical protein HYR63_14260 [Proteobacteria bacterium]|nr:hypothetical protein [Pseudomonadota bacterium]MBI3498785.1 hypothetical protein [Pseudomonadota bacterium]